jgi:two-component system, cell cycle response regulator
MDQKVLVIEDSRSIHTLIKSRLMGEAIELISAFDGESGLNLARELKPDLVLLDVEMPKPNGFEVCRQLKCDPRTMGIPVVFLTSMSSTHSKIEGLELGAVDYVTKPFEPAELRARVRAALRIKYLMDLLAQKAMVDGLTGLWNRSYLDCRLQSEIAAARRHDHPFSCIMADIDHFKSFNDAHGHAFGDEVLRTAAKLFLQQCRTEDVVCRYGGEEFAILTPGVDVRGAARLADRLRVAIAMKPLQREGKAINVTCSFGVADLACSGCILPIEAADQALYVAKTSGRNQVVTAGADASIAGSTIALPA